MYNLMAYFQSVFLIGLNGLVKRILYNVLLSALSLLKNCNHFRQEILAQYINNRKEHEKVCRERTLQYAIQDSASLLFEVY